jgi:hypothetical protein
MNKCANWLKTVGGRQLTTGHRARATHRFFSAYGQVVELCGTCARKALKSQNRPDQFGNPPASPARTETL